jgi:hypothetical protein
LFGSVCLCHGWYYSGDGRNGNREEWVVAQIQHGTFGEVLDDRLVIMQYNACGERC